MIDVGQHQNQGIFTEQQINERVLTTVNVQKIAVCRQCKMKMFLEENTKTLNLTVIITRRMKKLRVDVSLSLNMWLILFH
jgi:hypothetical protein